VAKAGTDGKELIYADQLRITAFGKYMLETLSRTFTYLELASLDCGIADEAVYQALCNAAIAERAAGPEARYKRMTLRLERATMFVEYLKNPKCLIIDSRDEELRPHCGENADNSSESAAEREKSDPDTLESGAYTGESRADAKNGRPSEA
jgi:hypothetical protein